MNKKITLATLFTAVFGMLMFAQTNTNLFAKSKYVLPTPTPTATPITSPITNPISYPMHLLSGNVSFRYFNLVKGWLTAPAANIGVIITSNQLKIGVIALTDKNGNYSVNLRESAYNIVPSQIFNIQFSPSGYFVILNRDITGMNFTGTPIHLGR